MEGSGKIEFLPVLTGSPDFSLRELRMRALVTVCDTHNMVTAEDQRRHELASLRRRARYERYRNKCNRKIETCDADLAVSVSYDGSRLDVRVQNPLTHLPTDGSRYTTYEIAIITNNIAFTLPRSYVRRRYSDFTWLRKQLAADHSDMSPPALPPKTWWGGQFEPPVIEQRLRGLRAFLQGVLLERVYLSNKALHLFVQTQLYTREMEHVINGRDKKSVCEHILEASRVCGSMARCPACVGCGDDDQSSCSSYDSKSSEDDDLDGAISIIPTEVPAEDFSDLDRSECEAGERCEPSCTRKEPIMSSTPQRSWSDSALVLDGSQDLSSSSDSVSSESSKEDGDSEGTGGCEAAFFLHQNRLHKIKPVLSQSLPTSQARLMKCSHRKRRVTFSTEVTVAKVLEKPEESGDEDGQVTLVQVHKNKGRTKGPL